MSTNKAIQLAVLVIAASALLYLGHVLTEYVKPILPWSLGVGIVIMLAGIFYEARKKTMAAATEEDRTL